MSQPFQPYAVWKRRAILTLLKLRVRRFTGLSTSQNLLTEISLNGNQIKAPATIK
jgi:hypothetical protein